MRSSLERAPRILSRRSGEALSERLPELLASLCNELPRVDCAAEELVKFVAQKEKIRAKLKLIVSVERLAFFILCNLCEQLETPETIKHAAQKILVQVVVKSSEATRTFGHAAAMASSIPLLP